MNATTKALLDGLKAHYRKPGTDQDGEVLVTEVTAPGSNRSCDLLRVGMWPSRGLGIDVHELKVSRSDWLRELNDPGKADAWWRFCSRFWIVAMPGIVNATELPEGWGLMLPPNRVNARRFRAVVPAAAREPEVSLPLLVEILRRADNTRLAEMQQLRFDHQRDVMEKVEKARRAADKAALSPDVKRRLRMLEDLEKAIGSEITDFHWGIAPDELAVAAREFIHPHVALQRRETELKRLEERLRRGAARLLEDLDGAALKRRGDAA